MKWGNVLIAAVFEVGWVMGLKYAGSILEWSATIVCIVVSFYLLLKATTVLPVGTLYAVFTGLGTAGTVIVGMVMGEPVQLVKLLLIMVLLSGVLGLKLTTGEKKGRLNRELAFTHWGRHLRNALCHHDESIPERSPCQMDFLHSSWIFAFLSDAVSCDEYNSDGNGVCDLDRNRSSWRSDCWDAVLW